MKGHGGHQSESLDEETCKTVFVQKLNLLALSVQGSGLSKNLPSYMDAILFLGWGPS